MNSVRGNFSISIKPTLTLDVSSGYIAGISSTRSRGRSSRMTFQYMTGPGFKNPTNGLQREFVGDVFGVEGKLRDDRFTGSSALNWQPNTWLSGRAVAGIDQTNSFGYRQQLKGQGPQVGISWGPISNEGGKDYDRSNNARYTLDVGATATHDLANQINLRRRSARSASSTRSISRRAAGTVTPGRVHAQLRQTARVVGVHDRGVDLRWLHRGSRQLARQAVRYGGRSHRSDERIRSQSEADDLSARRDLIPDLR